MYLIYIVSFRQITQTKKTVNIILWYLEGCCIHLLKKVSKHIICLERHKVKHWEKLIYFKTLTGILISIVGK